MFICSRLLAPHTSALSHCLIRQPQATAAVAAERATNNIFDVDEVKPANELLSNSLNYSLIRTALSWSRLLLHHCLLFDSAMLMLDLKSALKYA